MKTKNKKANKATIAFLLVIGFSLIVASLTSPLFASLTRPLGKDENETGDLILVYAAQDDFYTKLRESAEINVVTANILRCMYDESAYWNTHHYSPSSLETGQILHTGWDLNIFNILGTELDGKTVPLWLEELVSRKGRDKTNGELTCDGGVSVNDEEWAKFTGLFPVYAAYVNRYNNYTDIYCRTYNGKNGAGFFHKMAEWYESNGLGSIKHSDLFYDGCRDLYRKYPYPDTMEEDSDHETFYLINAAGIDDQPPWTRRAQEVFEQYSKNETAELQLFGQLFDGNPYLPAWTDIGSYSNVDGYFNYMRDFNYKCRATVLTEDDGSSPGVTTLEPDYEGLRIVAKRRWYKLKKDEDWDRSFGAGDYSSCSLLLKRIEYLRSHPNGINPIYRDGSDASTEMRDFIAASRNAGYEGAILNALRIACERMKDQKTHRNAWEVELEELTKFLERDDIAEDDDMRIIAEQDLAKLNSAIATGNYMEVSGKETEKGGKVYQCLDLQTMHVDLATYTPASSIIPPVEEDWQKDPNCYQQAGPLGWLLCPIIDGLRTFIIEKYHEWVEPALEMNATLFTAGDTPVNGTYKAWKVFRDIGNLIFVLFFIFVIFSQISGLGIDNYGIKKSLPKLFVAAVLINLSFLICQISVDLSNIIGGQIGQFLHTTTLRISKPGDLYIEGTTVRGNDEGSWRDTKTWGDSFKQGWLGNSALIVTVAAIGIGTVLSQGIAIVIPVAMTLIGVAISVIGLIIILGIRQAAAVLLVVASPLAFVCYMLPNTKSVYDKWFAAFKGLLVAYPVCSMVVYGSDMAATILLNAADGNTWIVIAAAVISIFPIFAIPKVIKQSVGAISGGIAALSSRASRSAKGKAGQKMRESRMGDRQRYSDYMRNQKQSQAYGAYSARKGRRVVKKYRKQMKNGKVLNRSQQRVYNAALGAVNSQNRLNAQASASAFAGKDDNQIMAELNNSAGKGKLDADMIASALTSMRSEAQATSALREMSKTDAWKEMMAKDPQAQTRIASAMASRRGSVINQSIGKLMNQGKSVDDIFKDNATMLRNKVQEVPEDQLVGQDATTFDTEGAADMFSNGQLRTILSSNYTGQGAESVYKMMSGVSDDRKKTLAGEMTDEQVSKLNTSFDESGEDHGSFAALGGAKNFKDAGGSYVPSVRNLNSSAGEHLRANMNGTVMQELEIDGSGKTTRSIRLSGKKDTISGDIDLNNMTEDDYQYIKWQHDHNPGDGSK